MDGDDRLRASPRTLRSGVGSGGRGTPAGRFDRGGAANREAFPRGRRDTQPRGRKRRGRTPCCGSRRRSARGRGRSFLGSRGSLAGPSGAFRAAGIGVRTSPSRTVGSHRGRPSQWARPLELAVVAAPGLDFASAELGRRYLVRWGALTPEQRRAGQESLRRAFRSESFLRAAFATALATLGPGGRAWRLCPTTRRRCGWRSSWPGRLETGRRPT